MAYKRKTRDVWEVQGNYGCGWERVTTETSLKDARLQVACYDANEKDYPHRLRKKREKIHEV